jgi:hypothetical protein
MKKFKASMFDYCKTILAKVSFSRRLSWKEYKKSLQYLDASEKVEFRRWVRTKLSSKNPVSSKIV